MAGYIEATRTPKHRSRGDLQESIFHAAALMSRGRSGLSRSRAAVIDGVNCNTSRDALGNGDEGWAFKYTLLLINSE